MRTKSLDTPTIDETLTNLTTAIATQDMTADELAIAQSEAKQALLQWVLDVIGEDEDKFADVPDYASSFCIAIVCVSNNCVCLAFSLIRLFP